MAELTFDDQYDDLIAALDQAIQLLRRYSKERWVDWLEADRAKIVTGDSYALDHLLQAFGGMGSLNDLIIHPTNGDVIEEADISPVNERLDALREDIWQSAKAIKRDLDTK